MTNLSQHLRSPHQRGHIPERMGQQKIIGTRGVVGCPAPITRQHVRGDVWRQSATAPPGGPGIVVVQAIEEGFAVHEADNSLRNA